MDHKELHYQWRFHPSPNTGEQEKATEKIQIPGATGTNGENTATPGKSEKINSPLIVMKEQGFCDNCIVSPTL